MKRACPFDANLLRMTKVHLMDYDVDALALKKLQDNTIEMLMSAARHNFIPAVVKSPVKNCNIETKKPLKQTEVTSYFNFSGKCQGKAQNVSALCDKSDVGACFYCEAKTNTLTCRKCGESFCGSCSFMRCDMLSVVQLALIGGAVLIIFVVVGYPLYYRKVIGNRIRKRGPGVGVRLGIFHPYCNDGGGGERVLWAAVSGILKKHPKTEIYIYTGDVEYSPTEILERVQQRFNIAIPETVQFVYLHRRKYVEAIMYPYFTLLGQSLGSMFLGFEALLAYHPEVYLDTMGYAFTYPVFKYIGRCKVASYTHYPTVTSDMQRRVSSRVVSYNNRRSVANSPFLTAGKLLYYKIFTWLYKLVGRCADVVLVNSSWTEDHINELWNSPLTTHRVYPPCDVTDLLSIPRSVDDPPDVIKIVAVGQFRPEKNHPLILRAMYQLRQLVTEPVWDKIKLVLIGACRNAEDRARVKDMEDLCLHLSLENNVVFKVNIPYSELRQELAEATIGLNAMWNEHFGIGVVECMAAGMITIAHRSGGPKSDIIIEAEGSRTGFLAEDDEDFARAMATIIRLNPKQRERLMTAARSSVGRFSTEEFETQFLRAVDPLFKVSP